MDKHKLLIVLIIIIAGILRVTFLDSFPRGLHFKEATIGWRSQNLVNFGKDEFGRALPFYFSNWTEMEMPIATYITLPFVALSPTSIFFLRLPFALTGILLILGSILLSQELFPDKKNLGLWVGFIVAISPVTIFFSRIVNPGIIALTLVVWVFIYFILKKEKLPVQL
jgi:4-amino-4-deoxy-L-arabinose transferase-like glycosyltransferase